VIAVTTTNRSRAEGVIVLGAAYLLVRAFWVVSAPAGRALDSAVIEATAKLLMWGAVILPIGLWLARRRDLSLLDAFGLGGSPLKGAGFGLAATIPMICALFLLPLKGFQFDLALGSGIIGPFAEELLFRGFLFGLLWRVAGWSIPTSILVSSLLFGLAHVPNVDTTLVHMLRGPGHDRFATAGGQAVQVIPGTTMWWQYVSYQGQEILLTALPLAAGGAVLAWISYKWRSLWPAIALHACMNIWWDATRGEHVVPALGPGVMSIAQLLSVALAIALTLRFSDSSTSGTSAVSGTAGDWNGLSPANDLQLKIVNKFQSPRT
jgi:membrane protease YdiL (CAAX protease family)